MVEADVEEVAVDADVDMVDGDVELDKAMVDKSKDNQSSQITIATELRAILSRY